MVLNGDNLRIEDVAYLVSSPEISVRIANSAITAVKKSYNFLQKALTKKIIYGVNTGFGPMASHIVGRDQLVELQENLIYSHATGMGEPLDEHYVLASMAVRLNTLAKGFSGVSLPLIKHLQTYINHRIIPVVPEHGAVGTSGDLTQLAHIALALIGEGGVYYKGKRQVASAVLRRLRIKPYKLRPKEGLALINGTSMMTGIAALVCHEARRLISLSVRTGALSLELVHGFNDSISERLHSLRPHRGQIVVAQAMRDILASSRLLRDRRTFQRMFEVNDDTHKIPTEVQEVYSLRCIPQILGPVYDTLVKTSKEVEIEINSVTDNPIIDFKGKNFLHGGNFHGDYIAAALDQLKMTIIKLILLSERRINFFLNRNVNRYFPPFMNLKKLGLNLGLQGLQFVATSTAAQSQTLAFPQYVHSIPTNADNQDIVSMGTDAALLTMKVIENAYILLAIELVTLAQAVDFLGEKEKLSRSSKDLFEGIRRVFPKLTEDRIIVEELKRAVDLTNKVPILNIRWQVD